MPQFGLQLVDGPVAEPVSLSEAKAHLRVDFSDEDNYISSLISAAREVVETMTNRVFTSQTWLMTMDQFPSPASTSTYSPSSRDAIASTAIYYDWYAITVPVTRLMSVTSITYTDATNTVYTLDSTQFCVDNTSEPGRIVPAGGSSWPYPTTYQPGSVRVTFLAGTYDDPTKVPRSVCQAILLLVGHWYANREAASDKPMTNLPMAVDTLLAPHKFYGGV